MAMALVSGNFRRLPGPEERGVCETPEFDDKFKSDTDFLRDVLLLMENGKRIELGKRGEILSSSIWSGAPKSFPNDCTP